MSFVTIRIAGPTLAPGQVRRLQESATDLMAGVLGKDPELTAMLVEPVAAHLKAKVTAGTNTAEEKARFVAAADALLRHVLGAELPVATYVVVDEVPGGAWGYGGLTQEHRRRVAADGAA